MKMTSKQRGIQNRLTSREFGLVLVLLFCLEGYLLFTFLLQPAWNGWQEATERHRMTRAQTLSLKADYDKIDEYRQQLSDARITLEQARRELPPYVAQEELILLLDRLIGEHRVSVSNIDFSGTKIFQQGAYKGKDTMTTPQGMEAASTPSATPEVTGEPATGYLIADQSLSLGISGAYEDMREFIDALEQNERQGYVRSLSMTMVEEGRISASMVVSFLSFLDAQAPGRYPLSPQMPKDKNNPFTPYLGYSTGVATETIQAQSVLFPDFSLRINSYSDNAPKVILSEYPKAATELYANDNKGFGGVLVLSGTADSFTYEMTLNGKTMRSSSPLSVKDGAIIVQVISQPREDNKDLVNAILDVDNQTEVPVEIVVTLDDPESPRFRLGKTTGNVTLR